MKTTIPEMPSLNANVRNSTNHPRWLGGSLFIAVLIACFAFSPLAHGVLPSPTPDGGYPGQNTAEGHNALFNLTTGTNNTAVGYEALYSNTTGDYNTATGSAALPANTTGFVNTATGYAALNNNTTGDSNTANGLCAR
jgi:hypothetical protein